MNGNLWGEPGAVTGQQARLFGSGLISRRLSDAETRIDYPREPELEPVKPVQPASPYRVRVVDGLRKVFHVFDNKPDRHVCTFGLAIREIVHLVWADRSAWHDHKAVDACIRDYVASLTDDEVKPKPRPKDPLAKYDRLIAKRYGADSDEPGDDLL